MRDFHAFWHKETYMKQKAKLVTGLIIGFLAAIGLDQWTKLLAVNHLMDRPAFVMCDGVF